MYDDSVQMSVVFLFGNIQYIHHNMSYRYYINLHINVNIQIQRACA